MKIHTKSKKKIDTCHVTPGGPWKCFSCYQILLINLYGMDISKNQWRSTGGKSLLSPNIYTVRQILFDLGLICTIWPSSRNVRNGSVENWCFLAEIEGGLHYQASLTAAQAPVQMLGIHGKILVGAQSVGMTWYSLPLFAAELLLLQQQSSLARASSRSHLSLYLLSFTLTFVLKLNILLRVSIWKFELVQIRMNEIW